MTLRTRQTRRDWWPAQRFAGLKRYAFIGDSYMYGMGVKPDETLPAVAERQLNEALPAWSVETVNYGVSGYNIWNSWVGMKPLLPMFDGLVLALCSNDAEMFSRTYKVNTVPARYANWEPDEPFGAAVAACFTEIGQCCGAHGLPAMVVFYSAHKLDRMQRVHEIIARHCADNGIGYIHTLPLYAARNLQRTQLVVSAVDGHPSALAHDVVARHLVPEMARLGWFHDADEKDAALAPARISHAAETMMAVEHYPADAALGWALGAMEAKTRVARRRAALDGDDNFEPVAAPVRAALQDKAETWHVARRAEACVLEMGNQSQGVSATLLALQSARLRLEELGFALAGHNLVALAMLPPPDAPVPAKPASELPAFFAETRATLAAETAALTGLSQGSEWTAAVAPLIRLLALFDAETLALEGTVADLIRMTGDLPATFPAAQKEPFLALLQSEINFIGRTMAHGLRLTNWAARLGRAPAAPYTKVVAVLRTSVLNGIAGILSLRAEYSLPHRLAFIGNVPFDTETQPVTLHFHVPLLYAGRVTLCCVAGQTTRSPEHIEILELTVSNEPGAKRAIQPAAFHRDDQGNLVSPLIFVV